MRGGELIVLAWLLAGCTTTEMLDFSDRGEPATISIACGESYKVYNQQPERRLIVESRFGQEVMRKPCADFDRHNDAERFAKVGALSIAQALEKMQPGTGLFAGPVLGQVPLRLSLRGRSRAARRQAEEARYREASLSGLLP